MRIQSVFEVAGVAAVTMVFTLMGLNPWNAGISDEARGVKPRVLQPHFTSQGCQFGLKTEKTEYQAGQSPVVELTAANPTGKAVEATIWVGILAAEVPVAHVAHAGNAAAGVVEAVVREPQSRRDKNDAACGRRQAGGQPERLHQHER